MKILTDFTGLKIKIASPEVIKLWSHGEVTKPETINYRTLRSEKSGLFSEVIFGPTKDWECYCGKYKRIRYRGIVCERCGVEVTQSKVRRERMGHIVLACPVAHIWFFKKAPSKLSLLLDLSPRDLESVVYFAKYLVVDVDEDKRKECLRKLEEFLKEKREELKKEWERKIKQAKEDSDKEEKKIKEKIKSPVQKKLALEENSLKAKQKIQNLREEEILEEERLEEIYRSLREKTASLMPLSLLTEDEYLKLSDYKIASFFRVQMGAEAVLDYVKKVDLNELITDLRKEVATTKGARHVRAAKRLRVAEGFRKAEIDPAWMILRILPVIPPDLRPMVQLSGGRFATSDLNDLYRRVINRNNRLKHLIELGAPEIILRNEKRMLQEAVDSLIDAAKRPTRRRFRRRGQLLRSLSDMLRGKQGRFRQNLLGKRVDYSGRSVIVVGPELTLNQCGLPKEMALELFKPFVLRELILSGLAPNVKSAKMALERRPPEVFDILEKITRDHPVLLNRAPTLHKLGIQAFYPILIEGDAIQLHPCVCAGFNADFDGDQMAVHVVLGKRAKKEAAQLMTPANNLLKPADSSPITMPSKEMILGCYFITSINPNLPASKTIFADSDDAVTAYEMKKIKLRQKMRVRLEGQIVETSVGRLIFNRILPEKLRFFDQEVAKGEVKSLITRAIRFCSKDAVIKLVDDMKNLGFWGATISGLSVGIWDCVTIDERKEIIKKADQKAADIEKSYTQGLITNQEKKRLTQEVWMETTEEIADMTWKQFEAENSVRLIINSGGTRASRDQVKQLSAMRGLVVDPLGKIVELPIKSNFREGLSIFEYVNSTRGSRKGLTDTALKTSDAGYLTRRLVDAAHDVIIREKDCKTKKGIVISRKEARNKNFAGRILGRVLAADLVLKEDLVLKRNQVIDYAAVELVEKYKIEEVMVRSPLTCTVRHGMCASCYGWDLSDQKMVEIGVPVGVVAAQSIGEPGTQLTMKTKHFGGIAIADVTQGLPRVEELFEARTPKALSPLSEIAGKVKVIEEGDEVKVKIRSVGIKPIEEREYLIPGLSRVLVKDGQLVEAGAQLASGSLEIRSVLEIRGLREAQTYLIKSIQEIYESQGIPIDDKHFEVIVRKMSDRVKMETSGDTSLLPGELVSQEVFEKENEKVIVAGGEPATAKVVILGVSRAAFFTDSWLSAASFQQTTDALTDAASEGKEDYLVGLKENVIIGRLIPVSPKRVKLNL